MTGNNNNSGVVFFLGSRAHYQVLTDSNANSSSEQINFNDNEFVNFEEDKNMNLGLGIKRRLRRSDDIEQFDLSLISDGDSDKEKVLKQNRVSLSYLLTLLSRFKRNTKKCLNNLECTYKDSCRCYECQSRYFDCDEDMTEDGYEDMSLGDSTEPSDQDTDDDEVFIKPEPITAKPTAMVRGKDTLSLSDSEDIDYEIAAGAPVLFDHLLNHPVTCCLQ